MNNSEIERIELALTISLPHEYRQFLSQHSDELDRLRDSLLTVATLWTTADEIIAQNKLAISVRDQMLIGTHNLKWPEDYLLVGTNGAGDYWFIDLKKKEPGLCFYWHESQEIERVNESFDQYLTGLRIRLEERPERERRAKKKAENEYALLTFDGAGISSLHHAAQDTQSTDRLSCLIAAGHDVNTRIRGSGESPLWSAVVVENLPAVELLIKAGADVNAVSTKHGNSPLHSSDAQITTVLLKNGANPNLINNYGCSPLHSAAYFGRDEALKLLLEYGADKSLRDKEGKTPLDHAVENDQPNVIALLR
jgi:SMI1/KNR4 family protein SUKH-1/ankyrin repeat protein